MRDVFWFQCCGKRNFPSWILNVLTWKISERKLFLNSIQKPDTTLSKTTFDLVARGYLWKDLYIDVIKSREECGNRTRNRFWESLHYAKHHDMLKYLYRCCIYVSYIDLDSHGHSMGCFEGDQDSLNMEYVVLIFFFFSLFLCAMLIDQCFLNESKCYLIKI